MRSANPRFFPSTLLIATFLLAFLYNNAQTWNPPVNLFPFATGNGGSVGSYTQMMIVNGNPAITCYDETHAGLLYMRANDVDGTSWGTPVQLDASGDVGKFNSLQIVNGYPAVSYYDAGKGALKYVRANDVNGGSWEAPIVVEGGSYQGWSATSLQVVNGNPAIAYYNMNTGDLKYIRANDINGSSWGVSVGADASGGTITGQYPSLFVINGNPAIAYHEATGANQKLKYVRANDVSGATWGVPVTIETGDLGQFACLREVNGNPAIAYYTQMAQYDLKYVRATDVNGTSWGSPISVATAGWVGAYCSMQIVNGNPAIAYYDLTNENLVFITATDASGTTWGPPVTVDAPDNQGAFCFLQIVNNNPAISYYDQQTRNLKYVRAINNSGSAWGTGTSILDVPNSIGNDVISLQMINGAPAITYGDANGTDLKYMRASNAAGTAWNTPVAIDAAGSNGGYSSLNTVSSHPAIAYYEFNNNSLRYVRAADANGDAWNTPVTVANGRSYYTTLLVVNGNPAISYYNVNDGHLYYVRAMDALGASWGSPVLVDGNANTGAYASMRIVDGNPAIAYFNTNGYLEYVCAADANGDTWNAPITLNSSEGMYASLQIVDGRPAIVYSVSDFMSMNQAIYYIRADDAAGGSWSSSGIMIDDSYDIDGYTSLQVVDGLPVITFNTNSSARGVQYVKANDASGNSWGSPVNVMEEGISGQYATMVVKNNNPAIAFYSTIGQSVLFVSSTNFSVLPVRLLRFTGSKSANGDNVLQWSTSAEQNSLYFELERAEDGKNFSVIARINAAGNSSSAKNYLYTDVAPFASVHSYRLKMVDKDGQSGYSKTLFIKSSLTGATTVYPNPVVHDKFTINTSDKQLFHTTAVLYSQNGKVLQKITITQSVTEMNMSGYPAGMYLLGLANGNIVKLVKE